MKEFRKNYVPETIIRESIGKQIGALAASGATAGQIAKKMGLTLHRVKAFLDTGECKKAIFDIGEVALETAQANIKSEVAKLAPLIVETLTTHLKDNNLKAIAPALKILGFGETENVVKDTNISIVLPEAPKDVTTEYSDVSVDNGDKNEV